MSSAITASQTDFLIGRLERRIAEQENNARVHPELYAKNNAEVRKLAYECALLDIKTAIVESAKEVDAEFSPMPSKSEVAA